jgi:N-ethylmaleimide reductase
MPDKNKIFQPFDLGSLTLKNRIIMAPMTRSRAGDGDAPTSMNAQYYAQRASAGLIITEGVQPSANGKGYCRTPGIYTEQQIAGWREVADAVHAEGGHIFMQLMHVGRAASALNKDDNAETVAPSAVRGDAQIFAETGMVPMDMPRALETDEIPGVIEEYRQAAVNAVEAGMDGVEIHCTSGYLPMQFLSTGTNKRSDQYGGCVDNRIRFVVELLQSVCDAIGSQRVGMRICPGHPFNDCHDDNPVETYEALLKAVNPLELAYLHVIQSSAEDIDAYELGRDNFEGPLMLNDQLTREKAEKLLSDDACELVSFGRPFIANPDLVERFKNDAPLAEMDMATLYSPGPAGYVDYPAMES